MKNSKLLVMIVTFIVMIILTPVIFGKLMNTKFNTMILNLKQNKGLKIKEIKDKSSYLNTDKIFDIVIPGSALNQQKIKAVKLISEVKFKKLPVTNVYFHNTLKSVVLASGEEISLKYPIVFDVTTPDFKTYAFFVKPVKYKIFTILPVKGVVKIDKDITKLNINNIILKDKQLDFYVNDFSLIIQKNKNLFKTQNRFNLKIKFMDKNISVNDVNILSSLKIDKKSEVDLGLSFKNLNFSKIIVANDFDTKVKLYDLNSTLFNKAVKSKDKNITLLLLAQGFKTKINSSLKNLTFLGLNQGGFKLDIQVIIYKAKNLKDFEKNFKNYLALSINADMSENFAKMLKNSFPITRQFLNIPPDKNGKIHFRIHLDKGTIK